MEYRTEAVGTRAAQTVGFSVPADFCGARPREDTNWIKKQPGFISTKIHRSIAGGTLFMNCDVRESVVHFSAAFQHPEFRKRMEDDPSSAVASPHLFMCLAVSNLYVRL
jgi:hypothetical protein